MLAVAYGALRARRSQSLLLALLAGLLAAGAAAAPVLAVVAADQVRRHDLAAAPVNQRYAVVTTPVELASGGAAVENFDTQLRRLLPAPGFERYAGLRMDGYAQRSPAPDDFLQVTVAARDGVCDRATVHGACPTGPGQAMLPDELAGRLDRRVGDHLTVYVDGTGPPAELTIVGTFRPDDPGSPYWSAPTTEASGVPGALGSAVVVTAATVIATAPLEGTASLVLLATPDGMRDPQRAATDIGTTLSGLRGTGYAFYANLGALANRITTDQRLVERWIPLVAVEFVGLGWYAVFFAVGGASAARRPEVGLVKLRGLPRSRVWLLVAARSGLPLLAGTLVGALAGLLGGVVIAGGPGRVAAAARAGTVAPVPLLVLGCVLAGLLGALLLALLAERRGVRAPVTDLLRQVPARRRGWRTDLADLVLVAVAVVGVWQARTAPSGFAVLASELLCLAAGLVVARALVPVAARVGAAALRAGRARTALTALHLARRPGLERIFALLVVTVAVTGYAVAGSMAIAADRAHRARVQAGAAQVLTVAAANRRALLEAVRAADPTGRYAMAAARTATEIGELVIAVDAERLAAVARWPEGAPLSAAEVAALLRPAAAVAPVQLVGDQLSLTVTSPATASADPANPQPSGSPGASGSPGPSGSPGASGSPDPGEVPGDPTDVVVEARLVGPDGAGLTARFGPLQPGRHDYPVSVPGCTAAPGCRLTGFVLGTPGPIGLFGDPLPRTGSAAVVLNELRAGASVVVSPAQFADRSRWRPTVDPTRAGAALASAVDGLAVSSPGQVTVPVSPALYPADAPVPLPIVVSRPLGLPGRAGDPQLDVFGGDLLPVRVAGSVPELPQVGAVGALVDLESADRLAVAAGDPASADDLQVWLAAGAPDSVVQRLRERGVTVLRVETEDGIRHVLATDAPATAARYQLVGALLALALAGCAVLLVAAVERPARTAELVTLRVQGLGAATARGTAWLGYPLLTGVAVLLGLAISVLTRALLGDPLLPGAGVTPGRVGVAALVVTAVLAPAAVLAGWRLTRAVVREGRRTR